jgi:hypothetical protein
VKVLLDECTPRGETDSRATLFLDRADDGLAGLKNGILLRLAENEEFEVVVTCDKNMFKEQTMAGRNISVVELPTNDLADLILIAKKIREVVQAAKPGHYYQVR